MGLVHGFRGLVYVEGVSLSTHSASIQRQFQLNAIITPANATNQNLVWTSSDTSIATVVDGLVTPTGEGTVTITVTLDGYTDSCELEVELIPVTGITLDKNSITINAGEQEQLTATITPSDASNPNVIWSSSNTAVAVVSQSGLVTYVGDGTCTITATTVDGGHTATCSVTCVSFVPIDCCFGYTGNEQSILLKAHEYKIQVWGAQGGTCYNAGGKGGYAEGCINLTSDTCVYIYVGGVGRVTATSGGQNPGGYNGGGAGYNYSTTYIGPGGGGGTDVRIGGNTLYHRRIVAGGGGGGGCYSAQSTMCGGAGGGANGIQGGAYSSWYGGTGGTQTAGGTNSKPCCMAAGSFGYGGYKTSGASGYNGSGGGGGWYGGGAGSAVSAGGGGGSGYVYTSSTCSCAPSGYCHCTDYYFTGACCCCGLCSFPTAAGGTETGHTGCGCVKITSL